NFPLSLWYPELAGYPQRRPFGYLKQDERNCVRAWISYEFRSLSALLVQRYDSGHPYSAIATVDTSLVLPANGYALSSFLVSPYYLFGRGVFRTDDVYSTDLAIQYRVPTHGWHLFAKLDILNALNNHAVVSPATDVSDHVRSGSPFLAFNPFTQTPIAGLHYQLSPAFGKPTGPDSYQTPRTFQVAIGARFYPSAPM